MKTYNIAVLGATGAVGREMLKVLEEYDVPVGRLLPLASASSAGKSVRFRGEDVAVEAAADGSFEGMDFVLGAVKNAMSRDKRGGYFVEQRHYREPQLLHRHHHDGRGGDRAPVPDKKYDRLHLPGRVRRGTGGT